MGRLGGGWRRCSCTLLWGLNMELGSAAMMAPTRGFSATRDCERRSTFRSTGERSKTHQSLGSMSNRRWPQGQCTMFQMNHHNPKWHPRPQAIAEDEATVVEGAGAPRGLDFSTVSFMARTRGITPRIAGTCNKPKRTSTRDNTGSSHRTSNLHINKRCLTWPEIISLRMCPITRKLRSTSNSSNISQRDSSSPLYQGCHS